MDSDESHFNVSLIVRDKVTRQCPQTTTFEEKGEPKRIRTEVSAYQPKAKLELELEQINRPFTATLAASSPGKRPIKLPNFYSFKAFLPFAWARERISIKMHSTESRFAIEPSLK